MSVSFYRSSIMPNRARPWSYLTLSTYSSDHCPQVCSTISIGFGFGAATGGVMMTIEFTSGARVGYSVSRLQQPRWFWPLLADDDYSGYGMRWSPPPTTTASTIWMSSSWSYLILPGCASTTITTFTTTHAAGLSQWLGGGQLLRRRTAARWSSCCCMPPSTAAAIITISTRSDRCL